MSTVNFAAANREHRVTVRSVASARKRGERLTMLTAYDHSFARIFDLAGIDLLLVGDSLGNVVQEEIPLFPSPWMK